MKRLITKKMLHGFVITTLMFTDSALAEERTALDKDLNTPQMITIPSGTFLMGSDKDDREDEEPVHKVTIKAFRMSQTEVTFALWDACVSAGGCTYSPEDEGWGRAEKPVINVSVEDIKTQFIPWLNQVTGQTFRLPSEAEWEYAARAGSTAKYAWGDEIDCTKAQYGRGEAKEGSWPAGECSDKYDGTVNVKSFSPNKYGLYNMHGNAWELVQDCYHESYKGAPQNGEPWLSGDCTFDHVLKGGAWFNTPVYLRSADRNGISATQRMHLVGFRLAQDLHQ